MESREYEIKTKDGAVIQGELIIPKGKAPWKTILLVHGSGPSDRHATVLAMGKVVSRNYDLLSVRLVKEGYAVFRFDKRESYHVPTIIEDVECVVEFISRIEEIKTLFVYGWSEGVRVITTIANRYPKISGLILQSGIAEGWSAYFSYILGELMVEKFQQMDQDQDGVLRIEDFNDYRTDATSISFAMYLMVLGVGTDGTMEFHRALDPEKKGYFQIEENWMPIVRQIVEAPTTLIQFAENAPGETWEGVLKQVKELQIPILVLHGLNDGWISPNEAVKIAKTARNFADIYLFKGLGHSLAKVSSPLQDEGGAMEAEPMETLIQWLGQHM